MVVIADTSPISYLVRIGEADFLPKLYGNVTLPGSVLTELQAPDGLLVVRAWARALPSWVHVQSPTNPLPVQVSDLHPGESDAIALAEELRATLLLIDDRVGAHVAIERGLTVTGTLGVLVEAAQTGLIRIEDALTKLRATNFRAAPGLFDRALEMSRLQPPIPPRRKKE